MEYLILSICLVLLTWEYITTILFQEENFLNRPKWLSFYGVLGTIFFLVAVFIILWNFKLKNIKVEEVNSVSLNCAFIFYELKRLRSFIK